MANFAHWWSMPRQSGCRFRSDVILLTRRNNLIYYGQTNVATLTIHNNVSNQITISLNDKIYGFVHTQGVITHFYLT
jgi:hypothetical protein